MEDIRTYLADRRTRSDEDEQRRLREDERAEWSAPSPEDEVPFHIPRD